MNRLIRISLFTYFLLFQTLSSKSFADVFATGSAAGVITSDTIWTLANSPIAVTSSVTIQNGVSLTIENGVVVKFNAGTGLIVSGKLVSSGVTFTANSVTPTPGFWNGIEFQNTANVGSVFTNCLVEFGGGGTTVSNIFYKTGAFSIPISWCMVTNSFLHGINTRASSPAITNCSIKNNLGFGVFSDLLSNFSVDSSTVSNNTQGGIRIPLNSSAKIFRSIIDTNGVGIYIDNASVDTIRFNTIRMNGTGIQIQYSTGTTQSDISNNNIYNNIVSGFAQIGTGVVRVERNYWGTVSGPFHQFTNPGGKGNTVSDNVDYVPWLSGSPTLSVTNITANITTPTTWNSGVYWIKNTITVSSTLTIKPNVIVKFAPGTYMSINGVLLADGTSADSMIVFTSQYDDVYGGDSNGDGFTTQPAKGDWNKVELNGGGNASSIVRYCLFQYGGSGSNGNLYVYSVNPAVISNIYSINSSSYGVRLYSCSNAVIDSSVFSGNTLYGIYQSYGHLTSHNTKLLGCNYGIITDYNGRFAGYNLRVTDNAINGIHADGGSSGATIEVLNNCYIARNKNIGVYNYYAKGTQLFTDNVSESNANAGMFIHNVDTKIEFTRDTVRNNGGDGITTSKAHLANNVISGNKYPIGVVGSQGCTFEGNTISGNIFNNAIALRMNRESLRDTLKALFPAGITSGTYVMTENSNGSGISAGDTLTIEPGVIIKMVDGMYFNIYGTLIANGTNAKPIIITSWRDSTAGGKTLAQNDFSKPAPNDWEYFLLGGSSDNSQISYCLFKYGGRGGNGMLNLSYRTMSNVIANALFRKSGSMGIRSYNSKFTIINSQIDSCNSYAIYADGGSPRSDVTVRFCTIQDISAVGLRAVYTSGFREVSNSVIRRCAGSGIGVDDSSIPQTFFGDSIAHNTEYGIYTSSSTLSQNDIQFIGNVIYDNTLDGIVSSAARFIDNEIVKNRFPIGCYGMVGNSYVDNNNVDGNIIALNTYNNAVILRNQISDSLKNIFPAAMGTTHAYVVQNYISISSGKQLTIDPGVVIKFQSVNGYYYNFDLYGTLNAQGTIANPVIFTSWLDNSAGGKTSALNDTAAVAPGDWNHIAFHDGSGNSIVRFCDFRYGGQNGYEEILFDYNLASLVFNNNIVRKSAASGMSVSSTSLIIDSCAIADNAKHGLMIYNSANNNVRLRNTKFINNVLHGINKDVNAKILEISGCTFSGNLGNGMYVDSNPAKAIVIGNTVMNNAGAGIYFTAQDNTLDTLLLITGNKIRNNGGAGLVISRAYVLDDSITGNKYAISVTGQLSLSGSGNNAGNVYGGNYIAGNIYEGTLAAEGTMYGMLGQVFPNGYTSKVIAARGNLYVPNGSTLSVYPGSIIKFSNEFGIPYLYVDGVLNCNGLSNAKIVFTSWKDDVFGGDSNLDSASTIPQPGNWRQIYLNGDAVPSIFKHTIVKFGGVNNYEMIESNGNSFVMDSCVVSFGQYDGFYIQNADPTISGTDIHHNNQYGIFVAYSSSLILNYNNIYQNGGGLYTYAISSTDTVNARNNFWGAQTGPLVSSGPDQNLTGTGDKIQFAGTWNVKYRPYLFTRSGILFGDVSGNGQISAYDGSLILQNLVNPATFPLNVIQRTAANVSGDTTVSALDASYILRYVVGLISGFPGLGKQSLETDIASAFSFNIVKGSDPGEFDLIIHLNKPTNIYGLNFSLSFDTTLIKPITIEKTMETDSMAMSFALPHGYANIAMAGITPLNTEGNVARLRFALLDPAKAVKEVLFTVKKFVLNETDVTGDVGSIILNVKDIVEIPSSFGLSQNFPNPFNPSTTIQYQIPEVSSVRIGIYNMLGQEVKTLVNGEQGAGFYSLEWNGTDNTNISLASGIYIYRIDAAVQGKQRFTQVKKMIMLK
jgi:parallel beta-helix repeat protein